MDAETFHGICQFFSEEDLELIRCEVKLETVEPAFILRMEPLPGKSRILWKIACMRVTQLIVDPQSPFSSAFVNRLWKRYMGLGSRTGG